MAAASLAVLKLSLPPPLGTTDWDEGEGMDELRHGTTPRLQPSLALSPGSRYRLGEGSVLQGIAHWLQRETESKVSVSQICLGVKSR